MSTGERLSQTSVHALQEEIGRTIEYQNLGMLQKRTDIVSDKPFFLLYPEYKIEYPRVVTEGIGIALSRYNQDFTKQVWLNQENSYDYRYSMIGPGNTAVNHLVQVDMVGLPSAFLSQASHYTPEQMADIITGTTYEFENSGAMLQALSRFFGTSKDSQFGSGLRAGWDNLRALHDRPIMLLATTQEKYEHMLASEFGKNPGESVSPDEAYDQMGYDAFMGPQEFKAYLLENGGNCDHMIYARNSYKTERLKKPWKLNGLTPDDLRLMDEEAQNHLLYDPYIYEIVKANAITFNIDNPRWLLNDPRVLNDTKAYMPDLDMGFRIGSEKDLFSPDFYDHMQNGMNSKKPTSYYETYDGNRLSSGMTAYLEAHGIDPEAYAGGQIEGYYKPERGSYGCFGHVNGKLSDRDVRRQIRYGLERRGSYIAQYKMGAPTMVDALTGEVFTVIHRNFMFTANGVDYRWLGGFACYMPLDSPEAKEGRNHGSMYTRYAEII